MKLIALNFYKYVFLPLVIVVIFNALMIAVGIIIDKYFNKGITLDDAFVVGIFGAIVSVFVYFLWISIADSYKKRGK